MKKTVLLIGALCLLFVMSACKKPCEHTYVEINSVPATCSATGTRTYMCSLCNNVYAEEIAMIEHNLGNSFVSKKSTCTEEGEKSARCASCGELQIVESLPLAEHSYSSKVITEATCTVEGAKILTCVYCSNSYTQPISTKKHAYSEKVTTESTCTAEGVKTLTCQYCYDSYTQPIPKEGHDYTSNVVTASTCTAEGIKAFTCRNCSSSYTETIAKADHNYSTQVISKATCTANGSTKYTCSNCNKNYTETVSATGHNWVDATCTKAKYCTRCNTTDGTALGHTVKEGICNRCYNLIENQEKQKAIAEENKRHEDAIYLINYSIDSRISVNKRFIESYCAQLGISDVTYSKSYYQKEADRLGKELSELQERVAYLRQSSSGGYDLEIRRLEERIAEMQEQMLFYLGCAAIAEKKEENKNLEREREQQISSENALHAQNLRKIEETYGN